MKIKFLPLILMALVIFNSAGCSQSGANPQSIENKTNDNKAVNTQTAVSKEIKVPEGIRNAILESRPDENVMLLTVSSDKQLYYQDKAINDSALKDILKSAAAKTKKLPKNKPSSELDNEELNRIYLKADAGVPFSEVTKILKMVQESSPNEYRAELIVGGAEKSGEPTPSPNGYYVMHYDLGLPANSNSLPPRPNPFALFAKLDAAGKVTLNTEKPMTISETETYLANIFKDRADRGEFMPGSNEIDKTITLVSAPDIKYGDAVKCIDAFRQAGATPILLSELSGTAQTNEVKEISMPTN